MVVVPLSQSRVEFESPLAYDAQPEAYKPVATAQARKGEGVNWVRVAAASTLALSGVMLMSGRRRAGLVLAVTGTSLAMLDQQESLKVWWETLPVYLDEVQIMLNRAQTAVNDVAVKRDKLCSILSK